MSEDLESLVFSLTSTTRARWDEARSLTRETELPVIQLTDRDLLQNHVQLVYDAEPILLEEIDIRELEDIPLVELVSKNPRKRSLTKLLAGIDQDIKGIFLSLSEKKLRRVMTKYGEEYGVSKLIYAKNTYAQWKSGRTKMSGVVVARLLNLVPLVLDAEIRFDLVKKLRTAYLKKEFIEICCTTADWFKKVPQVVEGLIQYSNQFELPEDVIEKLHWLSNGDAIAAQEILAAVEVDEANARTKYLNREYALISQMLSSTRDSCVTHTISLPQGTVSVSVKPLKTSVLQRLPLSPVRKQVQKRTLAVICKNPLCRTEFETQFSVYQGEPIAYSPGEIICHHCQTPFEYFEADLTRMRTKLNVEVCSGFFGGQIIRYDCPLCSTRLTSPLKEAGIRESCPQCQGQFHVPSP